LQIFGFLYNSLKAHLHMALPNNQSLSLKLGKAQSVTDKAPGYPNASKRTCFREICVGLRGFHTWSLFHLPRNDMLDKFRPFPKCLTTQLSCYRFLLMELLVPS
jgi:hypothetical protein